MMTGGEMVMECLLAQGAHIGFGVPGESYLAVLDAMHDRDFRFVNARHEGGAAFMAEAWAKLTGQVGLCFVTRGPGATNAAIGVHSAMQASTPMILFVGQVGSDMKGREAFQELDYRAVFGSMAKWAVEIEDARRIPEIIARAYSVATRGRPGPVVIALPEDILRAEVDASPVPALPHVEAAPDPADIARIAALLEQAERPILLAGGAGWSDASRHDLKHLAERLDLPVVVSFRRQDLIDNTSHCYAGDAGVGMTPATANLLREADVILAINARFGEMTTDGYTLLRVPSPDQTLIHSHAADSELGKVYAADLTLHAGPNRMIAALKDMNLSDSDARSAWRKQARSGVEAVLDTRAQPSPVDMVEVCAHLREVLPDDAILTNGAGNFAVWPSRHIPVGGARRLLAPQSGAMGYGIPAAIAASIEAPNRRVICFAGDGDFQMTGMELATAAQEGATPIILVLDNQTYGTIRMHQERTYPARVSGTDLKNPDFAAFAQSCGLFGRRVTQTADFASAFADACNSGTAAVLHLDIATEALTPGQTISQMRAAAQK
ncbi:thiamine pyrophosphate-binding protein [Pontibrevibacter nitratireducens]|uniref:Thiamine pyrophosphate-binding protein n=2 Tax=Pontivivens nitratireducens TaxID=2758038 RepID=A0A6G7VLE9_9RHOB|nr:thiamine pyrophosphate-dependent enzyme [Pontibrevibacter nitratireducens]QIK40730.1 thiamine pyrophosphate-binding protein [Pontibrevibacter nitratireducens]